MLGGAAANEFVSQLLSSLFSVFFLIAISHNTDLMRVQDKRTSLNMPGMRRDVTIPFVVAQQVYVSHPLTTWKVLTNVQG
jgi:hypothetical protein